MISQNTNNFRDSENSDTLFDKENDVIHCRQLNAHHAIEATRLFNDWMLEDTQTSNTGSNNSNLKLKIGLLQEPYLGNGNSILNFSKNLKIFQHSGRKKHEQEL